MTFRLAFTEYQALCYTFHRSEVFLAAGHRCYTQLTDGKNRSSFKILNLPQVSQLASDRGWIWKRPV
jgi:hypothetical protein